MRTLMGTIIGLLFLGTLGLQTGMARQSRTATTHETPNIRVREVRRETQAQGLLIVYELENASVTRWDLRRVEVHVFDRDGRRIGLVRPASALSQLERGDVEFIRARVPSPLLPEAHRLEVRVFVDEFHGLPIADPVPTRLVYAFPLKPRPTQARFQATHARLLRGIGRLQVERAGMVEYRAKGISLHAFYLKAKEGDAVKYVEDLKFRGRGGSDELAGSFKPAGGASQ